jgi:hypothetical protein
MAESNFRQTQYAFAAHIRDPEHNPAPADVNPKRMAMYRELLLNNIKSVVANGFPVLTEILDEAHWLELVQDFFAKHESHTPYFAELPEEFLSYLSRERGNPAQDPPFLLELAHYEWVELALSLADGEAPPVSDELELTPLVCVLSLSELAWPLAYRFPVQRIGKTYQPTSAPPEATYLVVYRDREESVRFMEVNPPTYRLLQILEENGPQMAETGLRQIAAELGQDDPAAVLEYGKEIVRGLAQRGVVGCKL